MLDCTFSKYCDRVIYQDGTGVRVMQRRLDMDRQRRRFGLESCRNLEDVRLRNTAPTIRSRRCTHVLCAGRQIGDESPE